MDAPTPGAVMIKVSATMYRSMIHMMVTVFAVLSFAIPLQAGLHDILPTPQQMGFLADEPLQIQGSLYLVVADAPNVSEQKAIVEAERLIEQNLLLPPMTVSWSNYGGELPALWMATSGSLPALEAALDSVNIPSMSSNPPPEGYHLYVDQNRILLLGRDSNGLRYGMLSLTKLISTFSGMAFIDRVYIRDWPDLPRRIITFNTRVYSESNDLDSLYKRLYQAYEVKMNEVEWNNTAIVNGNIRYPDFRIPAMAARDSIRSLDMKLIMSADATGVMVPNACWQEGAPVIGQKFTISSDTAKAVMDPVVTISNPSFESFSNYKFQGWTNSHASYPVISRDYSTKHHGSYSMKISTYPEYPYDDPKVFQYVPVQPHRIYHISFWYKTSSYTGKVMIMFYRPDNEQRINWWKTKPPSTGNWTKITIEVHSFETDTLLIYLGAFESSNGTLWIDDFTIEERNPIWLLQREDTPLQIYKEPGHILLTEGDDYIIQDNSSTDYSGCYYESPKIRRVYGGRLANGNQISMNWYCAFRYEKFRKSPCFTLLEPLAFYQQCVSLCDSMFNPDGFKIHLNEISVCNRDAVCTARNLTPAQIVGSYARQMYNIIQARRPGASVQIYADMFDPFDQGTEVIRAINGSMLGSLFELPTTMTMLTLTGDQNSVVDSSLNYFSQHGYSSIAAHNGMRELLAGLKQAEAARSYAGCQGISFYDFEWSPYDSIPNIASMAWNLGPHILHTPITFSDSASTAHITAEIYPDNQPPSLQINLTTTSVHYRLLPGGSWQTKPLSSDGA
ncbi:carbohydrate binding domain-containing protein, partial [bacterium]|nr:carbohydrate binding domain-containing protein [bacterium]